MRFENFSVSLLAVVVSWYGEKFAGRPTASGEPFDISALTCASNRYPLGTRLRVTAGKRSVVVRVNDRTARRFSDRIDLSRGAFNQLADPNVGLLKAEVTQLP